MSQFLNNDRYANEHSAGIDFDDAVRLPGGGSTCDIFRARRQRRDVFVKRLKEEYRAMPLYLDALDKEYDIGVSLRHPSLPEYREFHRDYIVMDYIDGSTLASMISRKDPWLNDERHILTMLRQLVDVVGYLHRHNVVHCDIKPDNIMITANGRNLVLIDFDKSYTDALNDTSGHPAKYGMSVNDAGSMAIDYNGIAMVVERLKADVPGFKFSRYSALTRACRRNNVTCDELAALLDYNPTARSNGRTIIAALVAAGVLAVTGFYIFNNREQSEIEPAVTEIPVSPAEESEIKTQENLHTEARDKAAILDQRISPYFDELNAGLDRLLVLKNDSTLSGQQLLDSIRTHSNKEEEYITEAFEILKDIFPDATERKAWRIMSHSKAYIGYKRRAEPELREYGSEIERRLHSEGGSLK